jgi:hypothetical protein
MKGIRPGMHGQVTPGSPGYEDLRRWAPQDGDWHQIALGYWRGRLVKIVIDGVVRRQPSRLLEAFINKLRLPTVIVDAQVKSSAMAGFPPEGCVLLDGPWSGYE